MTGFEWFLLAAMMAALVAVIVFTMGDMNTQRMVPVRVKKTKTTKTIKTTTKGDRW